MPSRPPEALKSVLAKVGVVLDDGGDDSLQSHGLKGPVRAFVKNLNKTLELDVARPRLTERFLRDLKTWLDDNPDALRAALEPLRQLNEDDEGGGNSWPQSQLSQASSSGIKRSQFLPDSLLRILAKVRHTFGQHWFSFTLPFQASYANNDATLSALT